jgi:hypothetical protein
MKACGKDLFRNRRLKPLGGKEKEDVGGKRLWFCIMTSPSFPAISDFPGALGERGEEDEYRHTERVSFAKRAVQEELQTAR